MADSGWIAVAGVLIGGGLTGTIALLQARSQHRFDTFKIQEDRIWNEHVAAKERDHLEMTKRHDELVQIYTRYQLAADRLENAVRALAEARGAGILPETAESTGGVVADDERLAAEDLRLEHIRERREGQTEAYEAAQGEYDKVCEIIKLAAPYKTVTAALQQRRLFNRFVLEGFNDTYDHDANYAAIVDAAEPVLLAMRLDLRSPE